MSTTDTEKSPPKPTGRRYSSVADLMKGEDTPAEVQKKYDEISKETAVVTQLALMRQSSGITQEEMGKNLGLSQASISKLECGTDDELTIAVIREYCRATNQGSQITFGKPMNHVESVKAHAFGIKHHLSALAALAHKGEELESEISGFFGEAFFNLLTILSKCHGEMPNGKDVEIRFKRVGCDQQKARPAKRLPATKPAQIAESVLV
jgi:transcriptional regulator with XRE-family HTH domain